MGKIRFGVVALAGAPNFFTRIAAAAPDVFAVPPVVARRPEKVELFTRTWGCSVYATMDEMLESETLDFVITSLPWATNPELIKVLVGRGVPVLSETPPAPEVADMVDLWEYVEKRDGKVCVKERTSCSPTMQPCAVIARGLLGAVTQAQVSAAHGYHGMSLMRKLLGIGYEDATIEARSFTAPLVEDPGATDRPVRSRWEIARRRFTGSISTGSSALWISAASSGWLGAQQSRNEMRGERGEIVNDQVAHLKDFRTPLYLDFVRHVAGGPGNLEGHYLKRIQLGAEWVYETPRGLRWPMMRWPSVRSC